MSRTPARKYATHNMYNFKNIIELYAKQSYNYDRVHVQHGVYKTDTMLRTDLDTDADIMFTWSKKFKDLWEEESTIPCYVLGAPFVHFRHIKKIKQSKDARGTIAFPTHSTEESQIEYSIDDYCEQLRNLPEEFQPVTICLHHHDVATYKIHEEYIKRDFLNIVCATLNQTPKYQFPTGFYLNLCNHKYATSNAMGTCAFYAVEMGIPFFLLGDAPIFNNSKGFDLNSPKRKIVFDRQSTPATEKFYDLFNIEDKTVITSAQKEYVYSELGINDCLSREEIAKILRELTPAN